MIMRLTSSAFSEGERIPVRYTCDGDDESPPLAWAGVPKSAKSLVLLCDDPDAPRGTWHHWAVYDIPPATNALPAGLSPRNADFKQATNDFRKLGYGGPCPPLGRPHHYYFRLLALSVAKLALDKAPTCADVAAEAKRHMIAEASLCGIYGR